MAEGTEITFGYLRTFREEHIEQLLIELRSQKNELEKFINAKGSLANGIRAGHPTLFPAADWITDRVNSSVVDMRDRLTYLIKQFDGMSDRLADSEFRFTDAEDDSVVTAQDLAKLIDPASAGSLGSGATD